ncbi:MAG: hypothetical protein ABW104_14090 [Candidatus Thiodiazotropha sp. 6PLUC2]
MTDSAGGVGGGGSTGSMGGGSDVGGSESGSSLGDGLSGSSSLSDSLTTGEQLANSPTTEDGLKDSTTPLGSALNSSTTTDALADNSAKSPKDKQAASDQGKTSRASDIAGNVMTVSTAAVTAVATHVQQKTIQGPVEHAIERLEASKDPAQMAKAETLRDANKPGGLKGSIHPDAVEYDVDKTIAARNQVLSDKSVIGNKLANDLSKVSKSIDLAESVAKKAGVVGMVAGPVIGSVSEISKLDENATTAEQITAGIVGAVKTVDNAIVGVTTGAFVGLGTSLTGPGAIVAATSAGMVAESAYKSTGTDQQFDDFIDNSVAPVVQSGVEIGLDTIDSAVELGSQVVNDIQDTASDYYSDWFGSNNGKVQP